MRNFFSRFLPALFCATALANTTAAGDMPARNPNTTDLKVAVLGSSTVWGNGLLDEKSMAGVVDDYLRDRWSNSVYPEQMKFSKTPEIVKNRKFFRADAARITGKGATVEFDITGDQLVIYQAIARTADYGEITVYANGKVIGKFDNRNTTIGKEQKNFTGNGKANLFPLDRAFTYNHKVTVNGKEIKFKQYDLNYVSGPVANRFPGFDGVIVRGHTGKKVVHYLYFFTPPKGEIKAEYAYGETIAYTRCTVGGTADENKLESPYGLGRIPHDLANPTQFSTGLDFRYSNPRAAQVFALPGKGTHRVKLAITGGVNPYLMIDFATTRNHQLMNAGIGGFTAQQFLIDKNHRTVEDVLQIFVPDAAYIILGGNDDWREMDRLVSRTEKGLTKEEMLQLRSMFYSKITARPDGRFDVVRKAGIIKNITATSLTSDHLIGTAVQPGHYLRIGNYYGDNLSTAVRRIKTVDSKKGVITWAEPLNAAAMVGIDDLAGLKGADFTIRTLEGYKNNIRGMIARLRKANPDMRIILLNTYTPNYFMRGVWAYAEALEDVASEYRGVIQADASPAVYKWIPSQLAKSMRRHKIIATGAAEMQLPIRGHWQGFQVFVNGKNVYGKDCRIESGWFYTPALSKGEWRCGRTSNLVRRNMKLVFTRNIPPKGTVVEVVQAQNVWSNDYAHPSADGCRIIGDVGFNALNEVMGVK